jgi:acyl-CoA thioester hydrolase
MEDFLVDKKIYYHDTDCGGVVYYANYLKYLEEARTEYLLRRGIELTKLAEKGILFVVARVEIDYKAPVHYQEKLRVSARVEEIKLSTVKFFQEIRKADKTVVKATTTLVCVGKDLRPIRVPEEIRYAMQNSTL